jgi:CNT family concentrative nucleoside transporter
MTGLVLQGVLGLFVLMALGWVVSENRRAFPWRLALYALLALFALALLLKLEPVQHAFLALNRAVIAVQQATLAGTSFVFGYLGGGPLPFDEPYPGSAFVLALQALPIILVIAALSAVLWHWRVLRVITRGFTWALKRSLGIGGPAGVATAANVFVGMVEAPILIKPVFAKLSRADLFLVMVAGMASVSGSVMVLYAAILGPVMADALGQILVASLMSVPAAVLIARIMLPATGPAAEDDDSLPVTDYASTMDAVTRGTVEGLKLFLNVTAMLIVLVALVSLVNSCLQLLPDAGGLPLTLQRLFGWVFAPLAWCLGIPWEEAGLAGQLIGTKTVLNELIAYLDLAALPPDALSERTRLILVYALCGFANFGSLGIMIGGLSVLAPQRQREIVELGGRSIWAGTLATCLTGAVAGLVSF